MPCDFLTAQGQRRRLDESKLKTRKGGVDLPIHSKSCCLDRVIRNVWLAMPTMSRLQRTFCEGLYLDSIGWVHRGGSVFSRQLSIVIYHPHDQDEFIEAYWGIEEEWCSTIPWVFWGGVEGPSNTEPPRHHIKRPGRGQSNASELTIARSDQLRGCCKKVPPAVRDEICTAAIWRCLVVATSVFVGLGPMSKSPRIHCWRVLCVPFLHCQRGNL